MRWTRIVIINIAITCILLVAIELGSFAAVEIKDWLSESTPGLATDEKTSTYEFPEQMSKMRLMETTLVRTHYNFVSENHNAGEAGFRGGQSDFKILKGPANSIEVVKKEAGIIDSNNEDNIIDFIFLGGSTTFGIGVKDSDTFPEIFRKLSKGQSVLNLGLGGNDLWGEIYVLLEFLKTGLKSSNWVFLDGINEDWCYFSAGSRNSLWFNAASQNPPGKLNYATMILIKRLYNKYNFTYDKDIKHSINPGDCASAFVKNLRLVDSLATTYGSKATVFLQPSAWSDDVEEFDFKLLRENSRGVFYNNFYDRVLERVEELEFKNLRVFDLRGVLASARPISPVFYDAQHLNSYGNKLLAQAIIKKLRIDH